MNNIPYLTTDLPGIGGQIKTSPEDFLVEEIPLYLPAGEGQHVYVEIEKRHVSTYEAIKRIAHALNISSGAIGYAGLKDAQAVTRQTLSIDNVSPEAVTALDLAQIKILQVKRHRNKLKIGHLQGNRFVIRVREVTPSDLPKAEAILAVLSQKGVPNFFGEQRFGTRTNTHRLGELLVRNDETEFVAEYLGRPQAHESPDVQAARQLIDEGRWSESLARWPGRLSDERWLLVALVKAEGQAQGVCQKLSKKLKTFFVSAFQSYLFNQLLLQRLHSLDYLEKGDVAYIHHNGAAFVVEDTVAEQPRVDSFEISPSGPMFGVKTLLAQGEPGQREQAILDECHLSLDDFRISGLKILGARRPYRFKLQQPKVWWEDGLMVSFELPAGAYATTVMAEVMKN